MSTQRVATKWGLVDGLQEAMTPRVVRRRRRNYIYDISPAQRVENVTETLDRSANMISANGRSLLATVDTRQEPPKQQSSHQTIRRKTKKPKGKST